MGTHWQAVIFDLDGTLIDSESVAGDVLCTFLREHGFFEAARHAELITGRTWPAAWKLLNEHHPLPLDPSEVFTELLARYRAQMERGLREVPGAAAFIRALHADGRTKIGLVSGSPRHDILWALQGLRITDCFEVILGEEDYAESKPSPEGFLKAIGMLGVDVRRTLIFEDSWAGSTAAVDAGACVIGVTGAHRLPQDLSRVRETIVDYRAATPQWLHSLKPL